MPRCWNNCSHVTCPSIDDQNKRHVKYEYNTFYIPSHDMKLGDIVEDIHNTIKRKKNNQNFYY